MPQREVVVRTAGHGVGVVVEHVVEPGRPQPEHQPGQRQDRRRGKECGWRAAHLRDAGAGLW